MPEKNLRAFFYKVVAYGGSTPPSEADFLWDLFSRPALYQNGISVQQAQNSQTGKLCEFRDMQTVGNVVKGCLAMLRDDMPSLRRINGVEAPLPVAVGERLLEKNYFLYYRDTQLLVWHFNLAANHISNIGTLLTALGGLQRAVTYQHLAKDIFSLQDDQTIEYVDLKVALPKRKAQQAELDQLDPTVWGFDPFKILADTGSRQLSVKMQNRSDSGLMSNARRLVHDLTGLSVTRRLRVKVEGAAEPVDMLSERFTYKVPLNFSDGSNISDGYFEALQQAKDRYDAEQGESDSA